MENKNLMETISQQAKELERRDNIIKKLENKLEYTEKELKAAQILLGDKTGLLINHPITKCFGKSFQKIYELCTAEEEGRLVVLPCRVGDDVYVVVNDEKFGIRTVIRQATRTVNDVLRYMPFVGHSIFLTREEAEAKLKEMQEDEKR